MVIVFARAPHPGKTKTRLIPALGPEGAARLHQAMVIHAVRQAQAVPAACELWCAPDVYHPLFQSLQNEDASVSLYQQRGADLGQRMAFSLRDALSRYTRALLVGTDCPFFHSGDLRRGLDALVLPSDTVLGAANDGGYVLIGMRRACDALFEGIEWGTAQVAAQTRARILAVGRAAIELGPFQDIDTPEDLRYLEEAFSDWLVDARRDDTTPEG